MKIKVDILTKKEFQIIKSLKDFCAKHRIRITRAAYSNKEFVIVFKGSGHKP